MTDFQVTVVELNSAATNCDNTATEVETTLASLRTMVMNLSDEWRGFASTEFQTLMTNWDLHARNLNTALEAIAVGLRGNALNYDDTERTNHGNFQAIVLPPLNA